MRTLFFAAWLFPLLGGAQDLSPPPLASLWQIGAASPAAGGGFALAPANYQDFLEHFGNLDRVFYIGLSDSKADWPYVLPGPLDHWAGSHANARSQWDQMNTLPIGFVLRQVTDDGSCVLSVDVRDTSSKDPPQLRVTVNGAIFERDLAAGGGEDSLRGSFSNAKPQQVQVKFPSALLRRGYNEISLRSTRGSWLVFALVRLDAPPGFALASSAPTVVRSLAAEPYAVSPDPATPATVRLEVFQARSPGILKVTIGTGQIPEIPLEPGLQVREIPAPSSPRGEATDIRVESAGQLVAEGKVSLAASRPATPADYVDIFMGTAHSRWMIAPGPWMPFGMVKISPDNQPESWCAGYDYREEHIDCFSHIHEWTMAGLGMMPTIGPLRTHAGLDGTGYSSRFDKSSEHGGIGYYDVLLKDSGIRVELTAATRASLQRYTFPQNAQARVLFRFLLPSEYKMRIIAATVRRTGPAEIEGTIQTDMPDTRMPGKQRFNLHFVAQFSRPFDSLGAWQGAQILADAPLLAVSGDCGAFATFAPGQDRVVQVRTGISLVSVDNARLNLSTELSEPFGWDFEAVVQNQKRVWNDLFGRVAIETADAREKSRFYTNLYRSLSGRNIWSDVNGEWIDPFDRKQRLEDPSGAMLGSDSLWNSFWSLNQVMNLMAPEWSRRWANSELELYDKCGWMAKGPAGLKYISIMVAEHEIPLLVGAYQSGLKDLNADKILAASIKMQTSLPRRFPGGARVGNEDLEGYLKYDYVPADGPTKGRTSCTLEYAYDDWCVGQLALSLGHPDLAKQFLHRSENWRNVFDPKLGLAHSRLASGEWVQPFDPYAAAGFVEGNAWQYTWFVPQNVPGLVDAMGRDRFIARLDGAFALMAPTRFNAIPDGKEHPINQGNEPAMHAPWLFNWAGQPWLTQKWTRAVLDSYYGFNPADAYLGDEDQGQMGAWFVMSAIGLYQTDGGCRVNPLYEIGSPLYPKTAIHFPAAYGGRTFVVEGRHASHENRYIQSATLNGRPWNRWWLRRTDVLQGGSLVIELGPAPNRDWAKGCPQPAD